MADFITASICLDKIPKDAGYIKIGKDGKKYISIVIAEMKEENEYGNTHYLYMSQTKEERDAKAKRTYIGNGKAYKPKEATPPVTAEAVAEMPPISEAEADDLPF